jgi:hypothetical protein
MENDTIPEIDNNKIACQQILEEDHSVFSLQMVVIPTGNYTELTSVELLRLYLDYIQRVTFGLIRPRETPEGIQFSLAGTKLALIEFLPPQTEKSGETQKTTICICGGFLVQPQECDRGQLDFIIETVPAGRRIILKLSDYCPLLLGNNRPSLWRKLLYRLTQAYIHKVVTVRFIAMTYLKITGRRPSSEVISVAVRHGKNT